MRTLPTCCYGYSIVQGLHRRQVLTSDVLSALVELNTIQIGHFTLDNAANNNAAMRELSQLLSKRGIEFDPADR